MPDPNSNNDSVSAANIDVAVYLEARNQKFLYDSLPTIFYFGFLSVMGLVGNSVVFMVYYTRYHAGSAMRYFVLVMSVTDMLTNAQMLPTEVLEMRFHTTFRWGWACRIIKQMRSFLVGFSTMLLVAVAVDRKQAVCKLQVVSMQASYKRVYFPVGSCLVLAVLLSLPFAIITGHRTLEFADNLNITGVTCNISDDFAGTTITLIYHVVLSLTFLIMICIMGVSYGRILLYLWRHKKKLERWQVKVEANAKQPKKDLLEPEPDYISFQSSNTPVSQTVPDSSAQPSPPRVAVTYNDVATIPNDVATIPNDVATIPNNVATIPNDVATIPNDVATIPNDVATIPNDVATIPNDVATIPNDVATIPNDVAIIPNDVATIPNNVATIPNDVATIPNDVATIPNDVATIPNDVATIPNDVATIPNEVATIPNNVATIPNNVATIPDDVATIPNDVANQSANTQNEVATTTNEVVTIPNEVAKAKLRPKMQKDQTMMFAVLTLVFVVSNMPHLTVVIMNALRPGIVEAALTPNGMVILIKFFYINSAVNPIVYSFCSPRFRFECRQFFARCPLVGSFLAILDG